MRLLHARIRPHICVYAFSILFARGKTCRFFGVYDMDGKTIIIAVAGKGGVGKTSLSAVIVKLLVENFPNKRILAIDADPAIGLSTALGIEPKKTIDDVRKETVEQTQNGKISPIEILGNAEYSIEEAICAAKGFDFIAIGRPESAGCYCKINTYLKDVIALIAKHYDFVVIDGEAGIEQINRRVMEKVSHLLLITDQSKKGRDVVKTIAKVASELVMYDEIGVIQNRLSPEAMEQKPVVDDIKTLAYIPSDTALARCDVMGENVFLLPDASPICVGAKEALQEIHIL